MERIINAVPGPVRRIISRGLSFPTLSRFSSSYSLNGGSENDQSPLPSAGKRQREASDDEGEAPGQSKRVKMDVDQSSPAPAAAGVSPESPGVEMIRPGVEALNLDSSQKTPPPANRSAAGRVDGTPGTPSRRVKHQRGLKGTRKSGANDAVPTPSKARLGPKRQCALLIGFCGTGYSGMQIQKDANTIEGKIFDALVKVGAVSEDNSDDATKVNIQRAARTDAGVHAARNVVSIKIIMELPGVDNLVALLNTNLPPQIRIWDIVRTQNSFNSRTSCDSRKYTYYLPTYMLLPPAPGSHAAQAARDDAENPYDFSKHTFWQGIAGTPITPESTLFKSRQKWRADKETIDKFKAILDEFIGTHNFWNFTVGREYKEAAAKRHMKSIELEDPYVHEDTEWLGVKIHGQSFMLHQIRKMIGLAVLLARSHGSPSLVKNAFSSTRIRVPKAPALGLLLEEPVFESYNKKITTANAKWKDAAAAGTSKEADEDPEHAQNFIRDPMDFEKHKAAIEAFKLEHIYSGMGKTESEQGIFDSWLSAIDNHEARLFYELRGSSVPSSLGVPTQAGKRGAVSAAKDDGDESDDALGKGKVNFKSVELEG